MYFENNNTMTDNEMRRYIPERPKHLLRSNWTTNLRIDYPDDWGLAITEEVSRDQIPNHLEEIFLRFNDMGWLHAFGNQCVFQSSLLRRILKLHGFNASMKQVVLYWEKEERGYSRIVGNVNNQTPPGTIDAHVIVETEGFIVDFACAHIQRDFGFTCPKAIIGLSDKLYDNDYQNLGSMGKACWTPARPAHPILKHWRMQERSAEIAATRDYFSRFSF